jgi:hypothetical protein
MNTFMFVIRMVDKAGFIYGRFRKRQMFSLPFGVSAQVGVLRTVVA